MGGLIGNLLLEKIVSLQRKRQLNKSQKQLFEIANAYLDYINKNPEDSDKSTLSDLEDGLNFILNIKHTS
jgi:hypothetical protein